MTSTEIPASDPLWAPYFEMPHKDEILVDERDALMTQEAFDKLGEYSTSNPSGVWQGKMWKAQFGQTWYLRWYQHEKDDQFIIPTKQIHIV